MDPVERVAQQIIQWFRGQDVGWQERNDPAPRAMHPHWCNTLDIDGRRAYPDAVERLVQRGLITRNGIGFLKLTSDGLRAIRNP